MATISPNTMITTKILIGGSVRRFKIPIKDLGAATLPGKLKELVGIPDDQEVIFERYSDSAGQYVVLDSNKPAVYKQLYRAAKAKLKLKIKATTLNLEPDQQQEQAAEASDVPNPNESTPPAYASQVTLPLYFPPGPTVPEPSQSARVSNSEPTTDQLGKAVSSAVAEFFESEECKTKIRTIVGEGIEKELEKRNASLNSSPNETQPAADTNPFRPFPLFGSRHIYAVYCNCCEANVEDVHYHCSICDGGDFDLCRKCKDAGKHCENNDHWLIKRSIQNGEIIASTTESIPVPKKELKPEQIREPQAKPNGEPQPSHKEEEEDLDRYCNACCETFSENEFVRCTACPDFDLCIACHLKAQHGHHPGHAFKPATAQTRLNPLATYLLSAGRNFRHLAICDGCEKQIYGVRNKCLDCPDWDYCTDCINAANILHPGHRFVPVYEALKPLSKSAVKHIGIYCDGLLCKTRRCIVGDRYKCAICPDFDLCASCEASPLNTHNPTHPLIKFKTAVRSVTVQTSDLDDCKQFNLGDIVQSQPKTSTCTASTQVQTVATIEPVSDTTAEEAPEPLAEKLELDEVTTKPTEIEASSEEELKAIFIKDTVRDGTSVEAGTRFAQTWTLFNNGNQPWPTGVTLTFTGGDCFCEPSLDLQPSTTVTTKETKAGDLVEFSVNLVAPTATRQHIGYWRLVTADGVRFGPSLWCDIQVVQPKPTVTIIPTDTTIVNEDEKQELLPDTKTESTVEPAKQEEDLLVESHTSQMIFPTLEKESPMSSINNSSMSIKTPEEESAPQPPSPSTVADLPPSSPSTISGAFDDAASDTVSFIDDDIEEEHFLSDDEDYDVVDASDEEDVQAIQRP